MEGGRQKVEGRREKVKRQNLKDRKQIRKTETQTQRARTDIRTVVVEQVRKVRNYIANGYRCRFYCDAQSAAGTPTNSKIRGFMKEIVSQVVGGCLGATTTERTLTIAKNSDIKTSDIIH